MENKTSNKNSGWSLPLLLCFMAFVSLAIMATIGGDYFKAALFAVGGVITLYLMYNKELIKKEEDLFLYNLVVTSEACKLMLAENYLVAIGFLALSLVVLVGIGVHRYLAIKNSNV